MALPNFDKFAPRVESSLFLNIFSVRQSTKKTLEVQKCSPLLDRDGEVDGEDGERVELRNFRDVGCV